MWRFKSITPWARRFAKRICCRSGNFVRVPGTGSHGQRAVVISITPPLCSYGDYEYAPYGCVPLWLLRTGLFLQRHLPGVGPWASWGYSHGWGGHRFSGAGGGRYVAERRDGRGRGAAVRSGGFHGGAYPVAAARGEARHMAIRIQRQVVVALTVAAVNHMVAAAENAAS
jgi:hypothetical protein